MLPLPDLYTRHAGRPFVEVSELQREYLGGERSCKCRLHGAPFESGGPSRYYCAWRREFERLPDHGPMRIHGRESWLGRHIERVEPVENDPLK